MSENSLNTTSPKPTCYINRLCVYKSITKTFNAKLEKPSRAKTDLARLRRGRFTLVVVVNVTGGSAFIGTFIGPCPQCRGCEELCAFANLHTPDRDPPHLSEASHRCAYGLDVHLVASPTAVHSHGRRVGQLLVFWQISCGFH